MGEVDAHERGAHARRGSRDAARLHLLPASRAWGRTTSSAGCSRWAHIFGSVLLNSTLRAGARIVTLPRFELEAFLAMVQEHRVTVVAAVPPLARALARHPLIDRYDLSSLRLVLIGAAPCPTEIERECGARLGCAVGQSFGMTELAPIALPEEEWTPGALGRLVPGVEAVVVDGDSGARLGAGETGELWLRGPALMAGYLGDEIATKATIDAQGWLHSGDLALFDEDGHLFVVDRLKELIKCRGYQVAPAQLEAELALHPAVADAAVVWRPDEGRRAAGCLRRPARPGAAGGDPRVAGRPRGALQAPDRGGGGGRGAAQSHRQAPAARARRV